MPNHTFQTLQEFGSYGNDAKNKCGFSLVLKVCREFDAVTSAGKLFHVRAAVTGNIGTVLLYSYFIIVHFSYFPL